MSRLRLTRIAGVDYSCYLRHEHGLIKKMRRSVRDRLDAALDGIPPAPTPDALRSLHRTTMILFAGRLKLDAERVLAADFTKQTSVDKEWLAAARVRRLAMAALVEIGAASNTAIGRAIGVTKQNIGQAVMQIADLRDEDPQLDAIICDVVRLLGGART